MPFHPSRHAASRALPVALAALSACLLAAPAHASRCETGVDVAADAGPVSVRVHAWTDPGVPSGTFEESSVGVTVAGLPTGPVTHDSGTDREPGPGPVEQATGVNPYSALCP